MRCVRTYFQPITRSVDASYVIHSEPQYYITVHIKIFKKDHFFPLSLDCLHPPPLDNMDRAQTERPRERNVS
jgi:hypothetical protein